MNPIDHCFQECRRTGRKAFVPFVPAGYPTTAVTAELLRGLNGVADLVEVGVPFSDPIADGPLIQAAYTHALRAGVRVADVLALGETPECPPAVLMASYSLIHRRGPGRFLDAAVAARFAGVVVPDLPLDEADALADHARGRDFKLVLLVTPTTPPDRAARIAELSTGFVYVVSVSGITGPRDRLPDELAAQLDRLRGLTDRPLCVGFGIGSPAHVRQVRASADGVIVGSALLRQLNRDVSEGSGVAPGPPARSRFPRFFALAGELRDALNDPA